LGNSGVNSACLLVGRILLAAIFIWAGYGKLMDPAGAAGYMTKLGVPSPGLVVWAVIAVELLGGLLILIGWQTRIVALALAGFCIATALLAHLNFGDRPQAINFMKNLAMAGGFLSLIAAGAGGWSVDGRGRHS
jgi:putative oxidoreductase